MICEELKRYTDGEDRFGNPEMIEDVHGQWVRYEDALFALNEYEKEVRNLLLMWKGHNDG